MGVGKGKDFFLFFQDKNSRPLSVKFAIITTIHKQFSGNEHEITDGCH